MVKILYDHQKFSEQRFGGITRYFAGLMQAAEADAEFEYQLSALYSNNQYIDTQKLPLNNFLGGGFLKGKPGVFTNGISSTVNT